MNTFSLQPKIIRYILITIGLIGLMIGLLFTALSSMREEAVKTHQHIANLHATAFEEHFSQTLQHVGITIDRIPALSHEENASFSLSNMLRDLLQNAPFIRSLSLLNDEGVIVSSSHEANLGRRVLLSSFLPIPFGDLPILRIGLPWQGRDFDEGRMTSTLEPLSSSAKSFLPILKKIVLQDKVHYVIANLNVDYLINYYTHLYPPTQGSISLWRLDGILLFSTEPMVSWGILHPSLHAPFENEAFFDHLKQSIQTPLDLFRMASLLPFIMEIKTNEADALGYWDQERTKVMTIISVLIILSSLLALVLIIRYYKENERQKSQLAYEKQFRIAMEVTHTGLWTWDLNTNELTWDPQCYLLLGYEPYAFKPTLDKIYELTHPDDSKTLFFSIKEQIIAHSEFIIERRMQNAHHEWVWILVRGKVIEFDHDNEPLILTGVYVNIDVQKKAEHLHLSAVAFDSQEAILITDINEKILKVNDAFTRITGYKDCDVLGKTPRVLKSGRHDKAFYQTMWASLIEKGFWQGELWNKRKNGDIFAEFIIITSIRNAKGIVTHYIANFSDITTHKVEQQQIEELAYYDPLTHLANRRLLDDALIKTIQRSIDEHYFGALLFVDLDHFKEINDTLGHDAGDMLLIQTAARLKECTRESDLVVRLGGDEFIVLLKNLGRQKGIAIHLSQTIASKILSFLREPYFLAQGNYRIGASIGCTIFGGDVRKDASTLIKEADTAMYHAKESGRNQIAFFE